MSNTSPVVLAKTIEGITGVPKSVKKLSAEYMLVEVANTHQS